MAAGAARRAWAGGRAGAAARGGRGRCRGAWSGRRGPARAPERRAAATFCPAASPGRPRTPADPVASVQSVRQAGRKAGQCAESVCQSVCHSAVGSARRRASQPVAQPVSLSVCPPRPFQSASQCRAGRHPVSRPARLSVPSSQSPSQPVCQSTPVCQPVRPSVRPSGRPAQSSEPVSLSVRPVASQRRQLLALSASRWLRSFSAGDCDRPRPTEGSDPGPAAGRARSLFAAPASVPRHSPGAGTPLLPRSPETSRRGSGVRTFKRIPGSWGLHPPPSLRPPSLSLGRDRPPEYPGRRSPEHRVWSPFPKQKPNKEPSLGTTEARGLCLS